MSFRKITDGDSATVGHPANSTDVDRESEFDKKLRIDKIAKGTVIDHVQAGMALKVLKILGINHKTLREANVLLSMGLNVPSRSMRDGRKDLIKIENRFLDRSEFVQIALLAPYATVSIIENYKITKKFKMELPDRLEGGFLKCLNPRCVTNSVLKEPIIAEFRVMTDSDNEVGSAHTRAQCE